jgi:O-antigen/teichoic acid export membrane protein
VRRDWSVAPCGYLSFTNMDFLADSTVVVPGTMASTPRELRTRIVSGMRWTMWLSILAVPFSFGTNVILARTDPEAIGTYGLLAVYIGLVAAFFYLGGDPVIIKFIPELGPEKRLSFLLSYALVVSVTLCLWLAVVLKWPDKLHYLFGDRGGPSFYVLALCLSPIYILFSMVVAALKGLLEIRWAQSLMRALNIGSFCLYGMLFLLDRAALTAHYKVWIWGIYLVLTTILMGLGAFRLVSITGLHHSRTRSDFYLPRGFWKYALATQQLSAVWFFINRLDYILVLNFGSLETLGKYVAITTIATLIPLVNTFFLDTLLPSLTNLLALHNFRAASEVFSIYMRISFLVNTAITCGLMLLAGMIVRIFGPRYSSLEVPITVAVLLTGLASPGAVGGTLLSSVGKQQRGVFVGTGQIIFYCLLFFLMWSHLRLLGAVIASGAASCFSYLALLTVAQRSVPIRVSVGKDYLTFALVAIGTASTSLVLKGPLNALIAPLWMTAMLVFMLLAGYRTAECRELLHCFVPYRSALESANGLGDLNA